MSSRTRVSFAALLVVAGCSSGGDGAPAAPQGLTATPAAQRVALAWTAVDGASAYRVYTAAAPPVTTAGTLLATVTAPAHVAAPLPAGVHAFAVTAVAGADESPPSVTVQAAVNRLGFTTSVYGPARLGDWPEAGEASGVAAGDAICQARAAAAGWLGTWRVWLSDAADDAYCRIHGLGGKVAGSCGQAALPATAGPWVRTDGLALASATTAAAGALLAPALGEEGQELPWAAFFTGARSGQDCSGWTSTSSAEFVWVGIWEEPEIALASYEWSWRTTCDAQAHLLCLELGAGPALAAPSPGPRAFVTSAEGPGNLSVWPDAQEASATGLAAGDAICQARAAAAGLAGTFVAWLSDATHAAADRIAANGPWVRVDGVPLAASLEDLLDGRLITSLSVTETGEHVDAASAVWTGTTAAGLASAAADCDGWRSAGPTVMGSYGVPRSLSEMWTAYPQSWRCEEPMHLYCFER